MCGFRWVSSSSCIYVYDVALDSRRNELTVSRVRSLTSHVIYYM